MLLLVLTEGLSVPGLYKQVLKFVSRNFMLIASQFVFDVLRVNFVQSSSPGLSPLLSSSPLKFR